VLTSPLPRKVNLRSKRELKYNEIPNAFLLATQLFCPIDSLELALRLSRGLSMVIQVSFMGSDSTTVFKLDCASCSTFECFDSHLLTRVLSSRLSF
jgi:hypothetical protein